MNFLNDFGVQPILLAAQVVNFLVLVFLLKRFLYKPILKVLDQRKAIIATSLKNSEEIEKRLAKLESEKSKILGEASNEAQSMITDATKSANLIISEAHLKAKSDMEKILDKGKKDLELESLRLHQEIRNEVSDLIVVGLQKIVGKVLTEADKKELVEKSVKNLS